MKKWQYKKLITVDINQNSLNELGQQGWELIICMYQPVLHTTEYVFKRPIHINEEADE